MDAETFNLDTRSEAPRRLGPRGGNLDDVRNHPHWREAPLNTIDPVTGQETLHTSKPYKNSAMPGLQKEQPWHLMAAYMLLSGRTNSEIATAAGVTPQAVASIRTQLWFQQRLALLSNEEGQALTGLIQAEAIASLQKIVEIRDSEFVKPNIALNAATVLLEQAHGKATQKIVSEVTHRAFASPADELASIQADLENIRRAREQSVAMPSPLAAMVTTTLP